MNQVGNRSGNSRESNMTSQALKRKVEEAEEKGPVEKKAREEDEDDDETESEDDEPDGKEAKKEEEWRQCHDDEGKDVPFEASSLGRVRNKNTGHVRRHKKSDTLPSPVVVYEKHRYYVSRLVCGAFHGQPPKKKASKVMHRDMQQFNNAPNNLAWSDASEINSMKKRNPGRPVYCIDADGERQDFPSQVAAAHATGINVKTLGRCVIRGSTMRNGMRFFPLTEDASSDALPGEEWKAVPGEGLSAPYEVSDMGRVRNTKTGRLLKGGRLLGYRMINFMKTDGTVAEWRMNRLVATAFLGPPASAELHVDHINGDKADNTLRNLRWATPQENSVFALGIPVVAVDDEGKEVSFTSLTAAGKWLAERTSLTADTAAKGISAGGYYNGFTWKKKE